MSILIQNADMPENCGECLFGFIGVCSKLTECQLEDEWVDEESRPDWCPLINVPPHGRLIDADALIESMSAWDWQELYLPTHFKDLVDDAPTVIEAEGRE